MIHQHMSNKTAFLNTNPNKPLHSNVSGRKEDSIRSWIKNPGPLARDSFSKFHETDNSVENSAQKGALINFNRGVHHTNQQPGGIISGGGN